MIYVFFILGLMVPTEPVGFPNDDAALFERFEGFSEEQLKPIYDLFKADPHGRTLLRNAWRKLKFTHQGRLRSIFQFCNQSQLGGQPHRRGLFSWEIAHFYREKGTKEWKPLTTGGLEKLNDPDRHPVVSRREYPTKLYEHLDVAFQPRICIKKGLNRVQAYLVLYHELTHLVGIDPFDMPQLKQLDPNRLEEQFYFHELKKPGGEMDAYLAQIKAFRYLKDHANLSGDSVLESFLGPGGDLAYRDKPLFLNHLLDKAGYRTTLHQHLQNQILLNYNLSWSWWEFFDKNLTALDEQLVKIEEQIEATSNALSRGREQGEDVSAYEAGLIKWKDRHRLNRKRYAEFAAEQREYIQVMEDLDRRFPR